MKLHLGCGNDHKKGYINCDISKDVNPDKVVDLEKRLPFKDNSVDEVYSRHTFEHINDLTNLMREIYRICKKDAIIELRVPYFAHPSAFQDPTHVRFFTVRTFEYFGKGNTLNYFPDIDFRILERKLISFVLRKKISLIFDFFINLNLKFYERFFSGIFPAEELRIKLRVIK